MAWKYLNTIANLGFSPVQPGILRYSTIHTRQSLHTQYPNKLPSLSCSISQVVILVFLKILCED